jgi:hypothetical protein
MGPYAPLCSACSVEMRQTCHRRHRSERYLWIHTPPDARVVSGGGGGMLESRSKRCRRPLIANGLYVTQLGARSMETS